MSTVAVAAPPVVSVEGVPLSSAAADALVGVRVQQRLDCPALVELTFAGPFDLAAASFGRVVAVIVPGAGEPLFDGTITAVERVYLASGAAEVRVRAEEGLHRLRDDLTVTAFLEPSAGGVLDELAARYGLTAGDRPAAAARPLTAPLLPHHRSDLDLLVDVAHRAGVRLVGRGDAVSLIGPDGDGSTVTLTWGEQLLEAAVDCRVRSAGVRVSAHGWDSAAATGWRAAAEAPHPDPLGPPVAVAMCSAAGARRSVALGAALPTEAAVGEVSQIAARAIAAQAVVLRARAHGDPRLAPGIAVVIAGLDSDVSGRYVLTATTHIFDADNGYRTEISSEPAATVEAPTSLPFAVGEVIRTNDPDGAGRVRVTLPGHGGLESGWLAVAAPGAGAGKGVVALPAIGDRVLLALPGGNPGAAVVLGSLWGPSGPPPISGGPARAGCLAVTTPAGHLLAVDDDGARLEHAGGSRIELSGDRVVVHAAGDLVLEAPGRALTLRANSIDFEQA